MSGHKEWKHCADYEDLFEILADAADRCHLDLADIGIEECCVCGKPSTGCETCSVCKESVGEGHRVVCSNMYCSRVECFRCSRAPDPEAVRYCSECVLCSRCGMRVWSGGDWELDISPIMPCACESYNVCAACKSCSKCARAS